MLRGLMLLSQKRWLARAIVKNKKRQHLPRLIFRNIQHAYMEHKKATVREKAHRLVSDNSLSYLINTVGVEKNPLASCF